MNRDALAKHLMSLFLVELEDHEQTLERDLLALERETGDDARRELIENVFRAAHSLKGAARAVHANTIETICHRLESALSQLRGRPEALDLKTIQNLLTHVDGVKAAAQRLRVEASAEAVAAQRAVGQTEEPRRAHTPEPPPPANSNARPSAPPAPRAAAPLPTPERNARVATQKLDALVASSGDLLVVGSRVEARLEQLALFREQATRVTRAMRSGNRDELSSLMLGFERELDGLDAGLRSDVGALSTASRRVDDEVRRLRMVPFREACDGLERSVRDLAQSLDKEAALQLDDGQVELDRDLAQRLRDPLLHIVRNAVGHGLERPDERVARGKPRAGTIAVRAELRGSLVELTISDDGRGLDLGKIRQRARQMGLPEVVDDDELAGYVFVPGLSTENTVSEISGRGVGLDAVKRGIEALHGTVSVGNRSGQGARFVLRLPLTLSKLRALHFTVASEPYAVPTSHAVRVLRFRGDQILNIGGRELVRAESELVPLVSCAQLLGLPERARAAGEQAQALVLSNAGRSVALIVGELLGERESIVHKLPTRVAGSEFISGASVLARGRVALVLNGSELARAAFAHVRPQTTLFAQPETKKRRVLVVDDSITTRALIKSIVEEGGYDVTAARDGMEALKLLQDQPFDLVVSDVQMPNLDGFGLCEQIRKNPKLARTPVVLVTSLEGENDKLRGLEAGANAYLGKSAFDHRVLLEVLGGLS
ncbi:MAG: response regulator [Polyangiales bacterium]